jgi:hypothetical protein
MRLLDRRQVEWKRLALLVDAAQDVVQPLDDSGLDLWPSSQRPKLQLKRQRQGPGEARHGDAVLLDEEAVLVDENRRDGSLLFAAFALSLPEGLGDLCLDLPSRQTDIVDQMGIGLRHLLKFPANAYSLAPGRDNASQRRQAVVPTRHFRRPHGRSRPRCLMRGRRKGRSIVHGTLHMV